MMICLSFSNRIQLDGLIIFASTFRSNLKDMKKGIIETLSQLKPKEEAIPGVTKASKWDLAVMI